MIITYKGIPLERYKAKTAGKNNDTTIDGFYKNQLDDHDKQHFFIKKPEDKCELFAEAFAGAILQELMNRKMIDELYHSSLIIADVVNLNDDSNDADYALIQPEVSFKELFKKIGTGFKDNSDRNAGGETFWAAGRYPLLLDDSKQFGLTDSLMFSLWLSAHSVHSANIVRLKNKDMQSKQYARIDWGDAFRDIGRPQENISKAYETSGILKGAFNYRNYTKNYFSNYESINGLYLEMAKKATLFKETIKTTDLTEIIKSALARLPSDLISVEVKKTFLDYAYIEGVDATDITLGEDAIVSIANANFASKMAKILNNRLDKITLLQEKDNIVSNTKPYQSVIIAKTPVLKLTKKEVFPVLINRWLMQLEKPFVIDFELQDFNIKSFVKRFNNFLKQIAIDCDRNDNWSQGHEHSLNMFTSLKSNSAGRIVDGHAFVPQYKEATILQKLYSVDPKRLTMRRFTSYEHLANQYSENNPDSLWVALSSMAIAGERIIKALSVHDLNNNLLTDYVGTKDDYDDLKIALSIFTNYYQAVEKLKKTSTAAVDHNDDELYFYPIDDNALVPMSNAQLATICSEELNNEQPSALFKRIVTHDTRRQSIRELLKKDIFSDRPDDVTIKLYKFDTWIQALEIKQLEQQLNAEKAKQLTITRQSSDISAEKTPIKEQTGPDEKYLNLEKSMKARDIAYERLRKMSAVSYHIDIIEKKAQKIEKEDANKAKTLMILATQMRLAIAIYENNNNDESEALEEFKKTAHSLITDVAPKLAHRQLWKCILANLALAVAGLGIGYVVAVYINNGHPFFAKTDSEHKINKLNHQINNLGHQMISVPTAPWA